MSSKSLIANFEAFSKHLVVNGIPLTTVNAIREQVSKYTSIGEDPIFKIEDNGIRIEGKLFILNFKPNENPEQGLGIVVTTAIAAGSALLKMLPPDFLGNTFGSVFANGFDLSCWGASFSEAKATSALEVDMPYMVGEFSGLEENQNTATLNRFLNGIEGYILASVNGQNKKYASCTRKGWAIAQKGAEGAKEQVLASIKRGFNMTSTGKKQGGLDTSMPSRNGGNFKWGEHGGNAYKYDSYSIEKRVAKPVQTYVEPTPAYVAPKPVQTYVAPKQTSIPVNNNQEPLKTASNTIPDATDKKNNTGLIIGGVALATLPFLFMLKKSPVAPKAGLKAPARSRAKKTKKR